MKAEIGAIHVLNHIVFRVQSEGAWADFVKTRIARAAPKFSDGDVMIQREPFPIETLRAVGLMDGPFNCSMLMAIEAIGEAHSEGDGYVQLSCTGSVVDSASYFVPTMLVGLEDVDKTSI